MSASRVHETAARGFEAGAADYERARPGYPDAAIDYVLGVFGEAAMVLDLGAGTGKLTRALVARGVRCVAVEPVAAMRRALCEACPEVWAFNGTAEDIPLPDESVDAVVVAQAFHWFRAPEALAEIRRVLRPGGRLALMWNVRDERCDWVRRIVEMIDPHEGSVRIPRYHDGAWRPAFAGTDLFVPAGEAEFTHAQQMDAETLVARVASVSFIAVLPEDERTRVLDAVRDLVSAHPDLRGRARFAHPYVTEVYAFDRR